MKSIRHRILRAQALTVSLALLVIASLGFQAFGLWNQSQRAALQHAPAALAA